MTKKYTVKKWMIFNKQGELIRGLCSVICPGCKNEHTVAKDGWSAIVCQSCKAELYLEHTASKEIQNG